jgi:signal transduction histidine kinase
MSTPTTNVSEPAPEVLQAAAAGSVQLHAELEIAAEIAHALLEASHPLEVCRLALARVTSVVGARFSSVYLRDAEEPALLRLHCAHNWPQSSARFLGQLRIRESGGPTGTAATQNTIVEVSDVFADATLHDWWEPARELGFVSIIALPLKADRTLKRCVASSLPPCSAGETSGDAVGAIGSTADEHTAATRRARRETIGAVSFYFHSPRKHDEAELRLLALVADQLAATAAKGELLDDLSRTNAELRRANEQLRRRVEEFEAARRLKDEFLANITHEFRTPLTSILGYSYLLVAEQLGSLNEKQATALTKIENAGNVLLRLITDLIDLSQLKLGQMRSNASREDAVMLARRAADEAGPPPAGVAFAIESESTGVIVVTDGEKVIRILAHLIRNAYKFTAQGGVTLHVSRRQHHHTDWVEWSIRDTGIGVRAEEIEVIFDEFRQADGSSTRLYGGAGLGLALSRRLAELLGGELSVQSEVGRGSIFAFSVPLSTARSDAGLG